MSYDDDFMQCTCTPGYEWNTKYSYERHKKTQRHLAHEREFLEKYSKKAKEQARTRELYEKLSKIEKDIKKKLSKKDQENNYLKEKIRILNVEKFELVYQNRNLRNQFEKKEKQICMCPF